MVVLFVDDIAKVMRMDLDQQQRKQLRVLELFQIVESRLFLDAEPFLVEPY